MPTLPGTIALTTIADGSFMIASDERNNFTALQTAVNGLINAFNTGTTGQMFQGTGTTITPILPPGWEYVYTAFTAPVTGIAGVTIGTATSIVTSGSVTYDGSSQVMLEFFCPYVSNTAGGNRLKFEVFEDSTDIGEMGSATPATAGNANAVYLALRRTPSNAAHTYTVKAYTPDGGTSVVGAGSGGAATVVPGYIRVRRV